MLLKHRIRIAIAVSLLLHLGSIGALAYWGAAQTTTRVRFGGKRQVLQLELVFSEASPQTDSTTLEIEPSVPDIVITPQRAVISRQTYLATHTRNLGLAEFVLPEVETGRQVQHSQHATRASSELADSSSKPQTVIARIPRQRLTHSMRSTMAARVPQLAGTDKQRSPDFRGNAPPTYPEIARQRKWQGVVLLRLHVTAEGHVDEVEVARSSGYPVLDAAAVNAVKRWRGEPGMDRDGRAAATVELLPVEFRLQ